jgi:plasmid stabilization system protein ParE
LKSNVRVTPAAEWDIAEAFSWYENAQPGLGHRFLGAIRDATDLIVTNPELFAPVYQDMRRVLLRVFPYALFYVIEDDEVVVLGCFHGRRHPRTWKGRGAGRPEA